MAANSPSAVFHGVLHNVDALRNESADAPWSKPRAICIAAMYERQGSAFVSLLEGEFGVALVDPSTPARWSRPTRRQLPDLLAGRSAGFRVQLRSVGGAARRAEPEPARPAGGSGLPHDRRGARRQDSGRGRPAARPGNRPDYDLDRGGQVRRTQVPRHGIFFADKPRQGAVLDASWRRFERAVDAPSTESATGRAVPFWRSRQPGDPRRANGARRDLDYTLGVEGCADQVIAATGRIARRSTATSRWTAAI